MERPFLSFSFTPGFRSVLSFIISDESSWFLLSLTPLRPPPALFGLFTCFSPARVGITVLCSSPGFQKRHDRSISLKQQPVVQDRLPLIRSPRRWQLSMMETEAASQSRNSRLMEARLLPPQSDCSNSSYASLAWLVTHASRYANPAPSSPNPSIIFLS